jgi:hypothetical protein
MERTAHGGTAAKAYQKVFHLKAQLTRRLRVWKPRRNEVEENCEEEGGADGKDS